ncbi:MAG: 3'-5' exonuclease, partial [Gemmatimonadaceae bacterium]
ALLDTLRTRESLDAGSVSAEIAGVRSLYDAILKERYDRAEPRLADLDQLQVIAAGYPDREAFLSALALEPPQATQDLVGGKSRSEDDCLVLSTAHSAKGKEWDAVFVIWALDGSFPSSRSLSDPEQLEEERRLMYVAMTRARDHLAVTYPLNSYGSRMGSDYFVAQLSSFIDAGVRDKMERVALSTPVAESAPAVQLPTVDLRALLRGRFG